MTGLLQRSLSFLPLCVLTSSSLLSLTQAGRNFRCFEALIFPSSLAPAVKKTRGPPLFCMFSCAAFLKRSWWRHLPTMAAYQWISSWTTRKQLVSFKPEQTALWLMGVASGVAVGIELQDRNNNADKCWTENRSLSVREVVLGCEVGFDWLVVSLPVRGGFFFQPQQTVLSCYIKNVVCTITSTQWLARHSVRLRLQKERIDSADRRSRVSPCVCPVSLEILGLSI